MTEPTDRDRDRKAIIHALAGRALEWGGEGGAWQDAAIDELVKGFARVRIEGRESHHNLPPLFEVDDWLWVAQCLSHVGASLFRKEDHGRQQHLDRIIAKILEYRADDVRRERR